MTTTFTPGSPSGGKAINLSQLQTELANAGVSTSGLGMTLDFIHPYDSLGQPTGFPPTSEVIVEGVIAAHHARRPKNDHEYVSEFRDAPESRRQEIRDMLLGLLPRDEVAMEPIVQRQL